MSFSGFILGGGNFGGVGSSMDAAHRGLSKKDAFRVLDAAWDLGIRAVDTSDAYGGGRSEAFIGAWLKARGSAVRDSITLATKTGHPTGVDDPGGLEPERIRRQVVASLQRLGVENIPLYLTHSSDSSVPIERTLEVLDELVSDGKVGAAGCSNADAAALLSGLEVATRRGLRRFEVVQNAFSLLGSGDRTTVLPLCGEHRLDYVAYSPLASGLLSGKYRPGEAAPSGSKLEARPDAFARYTAPDTFERLERFRAFARDFGVPMATLALSWVLSVPGVSAVIVGLGRPEQLNEVEAAGSLTVPPETVDVLESLLRPAAVG
jgi:aryl-alcohol dehydrogenase-like predicted oxidoreductase